MPCIAANVGFKNYICCVIKSVLSAFILTQAAEASNPFTQCFINELMDGDGDIRPNMKLTLFPYPELV